MLRRALEIHLNDPSSIISSLCLTLNLTRIDVVSLSSMMTGMKLEKKVATDFSQIMDNPRVLNRYNAAKNANLSVDLVAVVAGICIVLIQSMKLNYLRRNPGD